MFLCKLLVHSKHIAYLTASYSYIACRHIAVGSKVTPQLKYECLAEAHNLAIALAARAEVTSALTTAHRQCGECILECLLKAQELQD